MSSKKVIITLSMVIYTLFFFNIAFPKNIAIEKEKEKLKKNKISTMNEYLFFPKTNTQKKMSYQTFDIKGNKITDVKLNNDEKEIKVTKYYYDSNNNEMYFIEYDNNKNIIQKCESKYDTSGSLIGELFYNAAGKPAYKRISKYNKKNKTEEQILYDKNNKFINRSVHKYNNEYKTETFIYSTTNTFTHRHIYKYDKNYNLLETLFYDKNNKFTGKKINNYNNNDLLIETIIYNSEGKIVSWRKYEYKYHNLSQNTIITKKNSEINISEITPLTRPSIQPILNNSLNNKHLPTVESKTTTQTTSQNNLEEEQNKETQNITSTSKPKITVFKYDDYIKDPYNPPVNINIEFDALVSLGNKAKPETIDGLLEHNNYNIDGQNRAGITILMSAVISGNKALVQHLINKGASISIKDSFGNDALFYAKYKKNNDMINLIQNNNK